MKYLKILAIFVASLMTPLYSSQVSTPEIGEYPLIASDEMLEKSQAFSCMSVEDVLADIDEVELTHEMDVEGLHAETQEDDESDTAIVTYTDDQGTVVYVEYIGYGEDCFDYYTKSKEGRPITVKYSCEGDDFYTVTVGSEEYWVNYENPDPELPYGAEVVKVTLYGQNSDKLLQESINYIWQSESEAWLIDHCYYYSEEGFERYDSYMEEQENGEQELIEYEELLAVKAADIQKMDYSLLQKMQQETDEPMEMRMGGHQFSYVEEEQGTSWYLTAETYLVFDSEEKAEVFCEKYDGEIDINLNLDNGDWRVVYLGKMTIPVSSELENLSERIMSEIDDYFTIAPVFDEQGQMISYGYGQISFY